MLSNKLKYEYDVYNKLIDVYKQDLLPKDHIKFLEKMKEEFNFKPKVCYDIGAAVLHWTRHAERIWPDTQVFLFDAFQPSEILYKTHQYNMGVLSDQDDNEIKFYQNDFYFGGNSYYKEHNDNVFPDSGYIIKKSKTLDTLIKEKQFPLPDLIKIDVQGAELDILKGASNVLSYCQYLIVELQDVHYNKGAPLAPITIEYLESKGWKLVAAKFSDNGPDADYCFINLNKKNKNKKIYIYETYIFNLIKDYIDSFKNTNTYFFDANEYDQITKINDVIEVIFICTINNKLFNYFKSMNIKTSYFNTEPLSINVRIDFFKKVINTYHFKTIYDYSLSNIKILKDSNFNLDFIHVPYNTNTDENIFLTNLNNNTKKVYDYGFITLESLNLNHPISGLERRSVIIENLISKGYKVHIISGWGESRDIELAKCHTILNIHGFYIEPSNIFEHTRCDRLLAAGFNILSEESYCLDDKFIKKYEKNLKIIPYDNFLKINERFIYDYNYIFYYGVGNKCLDITHIVYNKCIKNNILYVPNEDITRAILFGDPLPGIVKNIFVHDIQNNKKNIIYPQMDITINLNTNEVVLNENIIN